jgi:ribosome-associated protein
MNSGLHIKNGITLPESELDITTSRSGGAGGQHVNKTETRVTIRWNVKNSTALTDEQKQRVLGNLQAKLTEEGDLIIHNSTSRSQQQNKEMALATLAQTVRKALHIPKRRMKTRVPKAAQEKRLEQKNRRSAIKKMRGGQHFDA